MAESHHHPSHPLTPDHLALLKDAKSRLAEAEGMVAKMAIAGLDTSEHQKKIADLRNQIQRIGTAYFPGQLT